MSLREKAKDFKGCYGTLDMVHIERNTHLNYLKQAWLEKESNEHHISRVRKELMDERYENFQRSNNSFQKQENLQRKLSKVMNGYININITTIPKKYMSYMITGDKFRATKEQDISECSYTLKEGVLLKDISKAVKQAKQAIKIISAETKIYSIDFLVGDNITYKVTEHTDIKKATTYILKEIEKERKKIEAEVIEELRNPKPTKKTVKKTTKKRTPKL